MIAALTGKCNGSEILFSRTDAQHWACTVPAEKSGTYVVELSAVDEAGNSAYFASILLSFDPATLQVSFRLSGVGAEFSAQEVLSVLGCAGVHADIQTEEVEESCAVPDITAKIGMG